MSRGQRIMLPLVRAEQSLLDAGPGSNQAQRPNRRGGLLSWAYFLLAFLLLLVFAPHSSSLTGKQLVIDDFHAEVIVTPDSSVDVTETIHPHFYGTGWHGLYRTIPVEYVTPQGFNYSLFLSIESITDGNGRSLKYESSRERHYRKFKIYIPNPDNSVQTVNIRYTVSDALRFFEDHDEFYWNVTGDEWTVVSEPS